MIFSLASHLQKCKVKSLTATLHVNPTRRHMIHLYSYKTDRSSLRTSHSSAPGLTFCKSADRVATLSVCAASEASASSARGNGMHQGWPCPSQCKGCARSGSGTALTCCHGNSRIRESSSSMGKKVSFNCTWHAIVYIGGLRYLFTICRSPHLREFSMQCVCMSNITNKYDIIHALQVENICFVRLI